MYSRPELSSPTSEFKVFLSQNNQEHYFHFYSNLGQFFKASILESQLLKNKKVPFPKVYGLPTLFGLDYLTKKFQTKRSLFELAKLFDQYSPRRPLISSQLSSFLEKKQSEIQAHLNLKNLYFKDNEVLQLGESIPKISFARLIKNYYHHLSIYKDITLHNVTSNLTPYQDKNHRALCNQDISIYEKSQYQHGHLQLSPHFYYYSHRNGDFFLGSLAQQINSVIPVGNTPFFSGTSANNSVGCFYQSSKIPLFIVSGSSRDPGQHIYHLFQRQKRPFDSLESLTKTFQQMRYITFNHPPRVVLESQYLTDEKQLEVLKIPFPLYHRKNLGNIWMHYKNSPIVDFREQSKISCFAGSQKKAYTGL